MPSTMPVQQPNDDLIGLNSRPKVMVILANLGTPDAPTVPAVRAFLKQFLSDRRVIEIPPVLWQLILRLFVLPFRPKRVAKAYASVWNQDSPMREILLQQVEAVKQRLLHQYAEFDVHIVPAMTYGQPSIHTILTQLEQHPVDHVVLFPLFPQYSATSTAPLYDAVANWIVKQRNLPGFSLIRDYYQHPLYIESLAQSVRDYRALHGSADKLLMSFHGIPQPYADKGDPYADRCRVTGQLVADALGLRADQWAVSFQSRFGKQEWVKPYTNEILTQWGQAGVDSVQVISPAFSADCLETLEELRIENAEIFKAAGGKNYVYIEALNVRSDHIDLLSVLVSKQLDALKFSLAPYHLSAKG